MNDPRVGTPAAWRRTIAAVAPFRQIRRIFGTGACEVGDVVAIDGAGFLPALGRFAAERPRAGLPPRLRLTRPARR